MVDPPSWEGVLWLSPDLAACLKTGDRKAGGTVGENVSVCVKARDKPVLSGGENGWRPRG